MNSEAGRRVVARVLRLGFLKMKMNDEASNGFACLTFFLVGDF